MGDRLTGIGVKLPHLPLPPPGDPDLVTVIGSVVLALGLMGLVTGWVDRRLAWLPLLSALIGAALLVWVWDADRGAFGVLTVPTAFVEIVARIVR